MIFHMTNNSIGVLLSSLSASEFSNDFFAGHESFRLLFGTDTSPGLFYGTVGVTVSAVVFAGLLWGLTKHGRKKK
jgi:hypothetical protein